MSKPSHPSGKPVRGQKWGVHSRPRGTRTYHLVDRLNYPVQGSTAVGFLAHASAEDGIGEKPDAKRR